MKVLHIASDIGPNSFGVGEVVRALAGHQHKLGVNIRIFSTDNDECTIEGVIQDLEWQRFRKKGPQRYAWAPGMKKAARAIAIPDIVHQHGIWTYISSITRLLHEKRRVPSIIAPHGSLQEWALKRSWIKKSIAMKMYEKANLFNCSCIHALSDNELKDVRAFGLKNPVAIIPNGISERWMNVKGNPQRFREKNNISSEKRVLLYLSRVTPKKGLEMLLEVMAEAKVFLREWVLVIAGPDEYGYIAQLKKAIEKYGLESYVVFVGPVYGEDKVDAFSASDAFILPSLSEGFSMAVIEAMAVELPVIVTTATPIMEINQRKCGWRTSIECDSLYDALINMSKCNPGELKQMGRRGKEIIVNNYTWERVSKMCLETYKWLKKEAEPPEHVSFY